MAAIPLPEGNNASETIRRLKAIDAEFFAMNAVSGTLGDLIVTGDITLGPGGTITVGDVVSTNYNGSGGTPNGSATAGYKLHESSGTGEFGGKLYADELHADGAFLTSLKAANITVGTLIGSQIGDQEIDIQRQESPVFVDADWERNTGQTWNATDQNVALDQITVPSWVGVLAVSAVATVNHHSTGTKSYWTWIEIGGTLVQKATQGTPSVSRYMSLVPTSSKRITSPGSTVSVATWGSIFFGLLTDNTFDVHQQYVAMGTR